MSSIYMQATFDDSEFLTSHNEASNISKGMLNSKCLSNKMAWTAFHAVYGMVAVRYIYIYIFQH